MLQYEGLWLGLLQDDLRWLVQDSPDEWPPVHEASWPQWWSLLRDSTRWFKKRVNKRSSAELRHYCGDYLEKICLWTLYRQEPPHVDMQALRQIL